MREIWTALADVDLVGMKISYRNPTKTSSGFTLRVKRIIGNSINPHNNTHHRYAIHGMRISEFY